MSDTFKVSLALFEAALDARRLDYETLITAIRRIELPASPDADELTRLFHCCYRILDFEEAGFATRLREEIGNWRAGHLEACAGEQIEHVLYDRNAQSRAWIKARISWHEENNREVPEDYLENDLPPELTIPWDKETARNRVGPLLDYWQGKLPDNPGAYFNIAWKMVHDGYPVYRSIMDDWMRDLDQRGLGFPGTMAAFIKADELLVLADSDTPLPWAACKRDLIPLLKDPHPMVVGGAARALGSFYAEDDYPDDPSAPVLKDILENLATLDTHRAIACGGFVCGIDIDCSGLYALQSDTRLEGTNFALDDWILKVVTYDNYEPYLPNAQAIWFYVHEHYDTRPEMVMAFIDVGRSWLAMMCATEVHQTVTGMKPVLERLAKNTATEIAEAAKQHLADHYS